MYPFEMGRDGNEPWFRAMETKQHEQSRKTRVKKLFVEHLTGLEGEQDENGRDLNMVGRAASIRNAFSIFFHDVADNARTLGRIGALYVALLCALSVLVLVAPGGPSRLAAWATWLTVVAWVTWLTAGTAEVMPVSPVLVAIRDNRSVILASSFYLLFLVLLPATLMSFSHQLVVAQAGGFLFLFVLWSFGWVFLWLQHRGAGGNGVLARCDKYLTSHGVQVLEHLDETEADGKSPIFVPRAHTPVWLQMCASDSSGSAGCRKVFPHRCSSGSEHRYEAEFEALEETDGPPNTWPNVVFRFAEVHVYETQHDAVDARISHRDAVVHRGRQSILVQKQTLLLLRRIIPDNQSSVRVSKYTAVRDKLNKPHMEPVMRPVRNDVGMMTRLPPGWKMKLKLWTLIYEGYGAICTPV